jgi:hypothetical protein
MIALPTFGPPHLCKAGPLSADLCFCATAFFGEASIQTPAISNTNAM